MLTNVDSQMYIKKTLYVILIVFVSGICISCTRKPSSDQGKIVYKAFNAIKKNDWESYSRLTITIADFDLRKNKINKFEEKLSYVEVSVKEEEKKRQREQYNKAMNGGAIPN